MKVITFGEIMLRVAPKGYQRLLQSPEMELTFGGGEANVAVSLAQFGVETEFVTKLPQNDLAEACLRELTGFGVGTNGIARGGARMGIYFVEKGASVRPSKVIYDRAGSAIAAASDADFNWEAILNGAKWFHFTGITPALSENLATITEKAVKTAKSLGLTVSCDLNYRKKLWSRESARAAMSALMKYVDVLIANEEDAYDVFGISAENTDIEKGSLDTDGYTSVAEQLVQRFGFKAVAITLRESLSASDNNWSALLYTGGKSYFSDKYALRIVDRVGGGDSFGAGLIYAMLCNKNPLEAVQFAAAASALKHTVEGDFNRVTAAEVESLLKSGGGRVQR